MMSRNIILDLYYKRILKVILFNNYFLPVGLRLNQTLLQNNTAIKINKVGNNPDSRIEFFSRRGRPMVADWYLPDGTAVTQSSLSRLFLYGTIRPWNNRTLSNWNCSNFSWFFPL